MSDTKPKIARCAGSVWNGYSHVGCPNRGSVERDGKPYCKRHDPVARQAKAAATEARWALQRKASGAAYTVRALRDDIADAVLREKESTLPASVAVLRRALLDAIDIKKNADAALLPSPKAPSHV